jgi:sortase A
MGAVGSVLLGTYILTYLDSFAHSHVALSEFSSSAPRVTPISGVGGSDLDSAQIVRARNVDFGLWAAKRIAAFEASWSVNSELPIAVLRVPSIDLEVPVFGDTRDQSLRRGVGWIEGTANPGGDGATGIAGHRDMFFRRLKNISHGDVMVLQTREGMETFRVNSMEVVIPGDTSALRRAARSLVLVTCYPFYYVGNAPRRFVVEGKLESRVWIDEQKAPSPKM